MFTRRCSSMILAVCALIVIALPLTVVLPTEALVVYSNDFENSVAGPEWSKQATDITPVGERKFLGQFGNEGVRLRLSQLPPHTAVVLSFDLYVIRSWDGNGLHGPDGWKLQILNGPRLLRTTFSNRGANNPQAYPEPYPIGDHPAGTGAEEIDTLGYPIPHGDSVYRLRFRFPHVDPSLAIIFSASGLQSLADESWGLDNVKVRVVPDDVGGSVTGINKLIPGGQVTCINRTTDQEVTIALEGENSWSCEDAGLEVNPGNRIIQTIEGIAK